MDMSVVPPTTDAETISSPKRYETLGFLSRIKAKNLNSGICLITQSRQTAWGGVEGGEGYVGRQIRVKTVS